MTQHRTETVAALLRRHPDGLLLPARDGAQLTALRWLEQLCVASAAWRRAHDGNHTAHARPLALHERARALHQARVALRRLRTVAHEHHHLLDALLKGRTQRALRTLAHATNAARDADAQREWLDATQDTLPSDAQAEVLALRAWLDHRREAQRAQVTRLFRRFDHIADQLRSTLLTCVAHHPLGQSADTTPFALHVADRLARGAERLSRDLRALARLRRDGTGQQTDALQHKLRIRFKRQRTMLASCYQLDPALGNWYALLTRGQDLIGALRDAELLATVAHGQGLPALTRALASVALSHREAFTRLWDGDLHDIARTHDAAIEAMRRIGARVLPAALPMEIERKYLLRACPPDAAATPSTFIEQGWLPGVLLRERLRRAVHSDGATRLTRTIKLGPMGARIEVEEDTDPALFDALWPCTVDARIRKHRYVVPDGRFLWEIDVFLDRDLVVAEVELDHGDDVPAAPAWLAPHIVRDISDDPAYLNAAMARSDRLGHAHRP